MQVLAIMKEFLLQFISNVNKLFGNDDSCDDL